MKDDFAYSLRPTFLGAGSGGDPSGEPSGAGGAKDNDGSDDGEGGNTQYVSGTWERDANNITLYATDKPQGPTEDNHSSSEPNVTLAASDSDGSDSGAVLVRGNRLVRITSGTSSEVQSDEDPDLPAPQMGIQMQVGNDHEISLQRGTKDNPNLGVIAMSDDGIWADANQGMFLVTSKTMIKFQVAGGTSSIILTPSRVIIKGPIITLN